MRHTLWIRILVLGSLGLSTACGPSAPEADAPPMPGAKQGLTGLTVYTNRFGMSFRLVPNGSFTMGSPASETWHLPGEVQHQVTLTAAYYLQTTELTQQQWNEVMGETSQASSLPKTNVNRDDVLAFIARLNQQGQGVYRLPTEAEWEYAARAGTTSAYSFGDEAAKLRDYAWYQVNYDGLNAGSPVAGKLPNPWGFYDMHGNLSEWVQDWFGPMTSSPATDPKGPSFGTRGITRGGSGIDGEWALRSAARSSMGDDPYLRASTNGFRLVREP